MTYTDLRHMMQSDFKNVIFIDEYIFIHYYNSIVSLIT